jgi:hypothetical protein
VLPIPRRALNTASSKIETFDHATKVSGEVMIANCTESASDALRELAGWLVRDGIDADHLEVYMSQLLHHQLMELHASCRFQAMEVVRQGATLSAAGVAARLCSVADGIDNGNFANELGRTAGRRVSSSHVQRRQRPTDSAKAGSDHTSALSGGALSWLPEVIGAAAFTTIALLLMPSECGDFSLRVMAASMYGLVGLTHAAVAIHSAWQSVHAQRRTPNN